MYAIVDIAGFQEKVEKGSKLKVPLLDGKEGSSVSFEKVLLTDDAGSVKVGTPYVSGVTVEAKILEHGKGDKIIVRKFKRRKRYRKTQGHRQGFTEIEILNIGAGKTATKAKTKETEQKEPAAATTKEASKE